MYVLVCEGLSNDDVGVTKATEFHETRQGAGFKAADFVIEKLGATAENDS